MKGRLIFWPLLAVLVLALFAQSNRLADRLVASSILRQTELLSLQAARAGDEGRELLRRNLQALRQARRRDPSEVGIPLAMGSIHRLLDNPQAAADTYRRALALEPRPEIYLNLGLAQGRAGDVEAARESFSKALALDPSLRRQVPRELRPIPPRPPGR